MHTTNHLNFEQLFCSSNIPDLLKLAIFSNLFQNSFNLMYIFKKNIIIAPPP